MIEIDELLIVFSSATTATRLKNELTKKRFPAKVVQTPKNLTKNGCSYSVKTSLSALSAAETFAETSGVKIKNIFRFNGNDYVIYR